MESRLVRSDIFQRFLGNFNTTKKYIVYHEKKNASLDTANVFLADYLIHTLSNTHTI